MQTREVQPASILTRTSGYLEDVCSHSLQPFTGCALGRSLCGVGCYAQHQRFKTNGRPWGHFLDVKHNASELYQKSYAKELGWARRNRGKMSIFFSSSTEPFPPQERQLGVSRSILESMMEMPPDLLIIQTHSHLVAEFSELLFQLNQKMELRMHLTIETDIDRLPGLPGHFSPIIKRIQAAKSLIELGLRVVITVAPLLPIENPDRFFQQLSQVADAVVIDHFIEGDGSRNGSRTRRTELPASIHQINPAALNLQYREKIASTALKYFPGRVGIGMQGFAGNFNFGKLI
jgi:DNA repair photolyase